MKLTCVTAVFNAIESAHREHLMRCVKSVAELKTEHEHLVYDGASTDGTTELLRELEAETPGLKVFSEPDTGIYNALNKGVRDAQGEWFYVLGCDDRIDHPEVLDRLLATTAEETKAIVSPVERDGKNPFFRDMKSLRILFWTVPYSHQGLVMKTDVIRQFGGFDERYSICADWDLMLKAHEAALAFRYTFEPFAFYATGGASETGPRGWNEVTEVLQAHLNMTDPQTARFRKNGYPPVYKMIRFAFHPDVALRMSSRHMLGMAIKAPVCPIARPLKRRLGAAVARLLNQRRITKDT